MVGDLMRRLDVPARLYCSLVDRPGAHEHVSQWRGRCTYCGHRVGVNVRQTREQPWRIPAEIVLRFLAMGKGDALQDTLARLRRPGSPWIETTAINCPLEFSHAAEVVSYRLTTDGKMVARDA